MTQITVYTAAAWFSTTPIASINPHWTEEARIILRLRAKGRPLRHIAAVLTRLEGTPHNRETVNRRLTWALEVYETNKNL